MEVCKREEVWRKMFEGVKRGRVERRERMVERRRRNREM